jgi:hypothetical protein
MPANHRVYRPASTPLSLARHRCKPHPRGPALRHALPRTPHLLSPTHRPLPQLNRIGGQGGFVVSPAERQRAPCVGSQGAAQPPTRVSIDRTSQSLTHVSPSPPPPTRPNRTHLARQPTVQPVAHRRPLRAGCRSAASARCPRAHLLALSAQHPLHAVTRPRGDECPSGLCIAAAAGARDPFLAE